MRISPQNPRPSTGHTVEAKATAKSAQSVLFQRSAMNSLAKSPSSKSMVSRDVLTAIAADLKNGVISREQANGRFVAAVIDHSLKGKLGDEDREKMISDIRDFFADDQEFSQKLAKNLHDLI